MGEHTSIEWCHATFNPWRGCTKVSAGCHACYAETLSHRNPATLGVWGPNGTRVVASEATWREPLKWDRKAREAGERRRVFCASLADVFEDWRGPMLDSSGNVLHYNSAATWWTPEPTTHGPIPMRFVRERLFNLICNTPSLDWLVLTKRPENALRMMVEAGLYTVENPDLPCPQRNLWIGTSVEDQATADARIPHLLRTPAAVRFLSMEPLLGPVDLKLWRVEIPKHREHWPVERVGNFWVIVGGESGPKARPMHPQWARSIRDQCVAAGVPFHFKQWGEHMPIGRTDRGISHPKPDPSLVVVWKNEHRLCNDGYLMKRVGKRGAGRNLDGAMWDQFPAPALPEPSPR